jgi:hypothetical protein
LFKELKGYVQKYIEKEESQSDYKMNNKAQKQMKQLVISLKSLLREVVLCEDDGQ